ncbi:MAG: hypothetical protein ACFFCQ_04790 [Promethearchaeota archaeon]
MSSTWCESDGAEFTLIWWNSSISSPKSRDEIAPAVPRGGGTRKQETKLDSWTI